MKDEDEDESEFGEIIRSCKALLPPTCNIQHVRRNRNEAAHVIVNRSLFCAEPVEVGVPLDWLIGALRCSCTDNS
ncbi:hypothetical protein LINPERHAP1_LOCUS17480 [Linum perenne]